MGKLTYQQKLDALSYRFYQGGQWTPKAGDFYTTSRADLELYQIVSVEGGVVRTRFTEGSDAISEWPEAGFLTDGFGPRRVFVPPWVLYAPEAFAPQAEAWHPIKKAIWDKIIAAEVNGESYINAWSLTDAIYDAVCKAIYPPTAPHLGLNLKPLDWDKQHQTHYANSLFGNYSIWEAGSVFYLRSPGEHAGRVVGTTLEEAKGAALRDIEERIHAAIVPAPRQPFAAMTVDYLGCEFMSRDVAQIERIAKGGSKGPTPVTYLFDAPPAPQATGDDKPFDQASSHPEWIWYCESTDGVSVTSLGRWPRHPQQRRYKYAEIQETEHDHPAPPAPHLAALEEIKYLACTAGAPGHTPVSKALARILFLCNSAGVTKKLDELRPLFASRKDINNAL